MQIRFWKLSDERHELAVCRDRAAWEATDCETRSYLVHDLLHYAVESAAGLPSGFWGRLAAGATLAPMNDRTRSMDAEMAVIEQLVGALSMSVKGPPAAEVVARLQSFASSMGGTTPTFLTEDFVLAVQERMRQLLGRWKATPRGAALELTWPEGPAGTTTPDE
jgi:hypothetical protein